MALPPVPMGKFTKRSVTFALKSTSAGSELQHLSLSLVCLLTTY